MAFTLPPRWLSHLLGIGKGEVVSVPWEPLHESILGWKTLQYFPACNLVKQMSQMENLLNNSLPYKASEVLSTAHLNCNTLYCLWYFQSSCSIIFLPDLEPYSSPPRGEERFGYKSTYLKTNSGLTSSADSFLCLFDSYSLNCHTPLLTE